MRKILILFLAAFISACPGFTRRATAPVASATAGCRTDADRATCTNNPQQCVCEAFGDCNMPKCIERGEVVLLERTRTGSGSAPTPAGAPSSGTRPRPATPAASNPPPIERAAAIPVAASTASGARTPSGGRTCGSQADLTQCSQESFYCPCDAYGDCGHDFCQEPKVKPRDSMRVCQSPDDRAICKENPADCPCSVHGTCSMPECTLETTPPPATVTSTTPAPPRVVPEPDNVPESMPAKHPCATAGEMKTCRTDQWDCPCEAYGDCSMPNCR